MRSVRCLPTGSTYADRICSILLWLTAACDLDHTRAGRWKPLGYAVVPERIACIYAQLAA
jgi:hypothetical protein